MRWALSAALKDSSCSVKGNIAPLVFSAAHRAEDGDTGKEAAFRDNQPLRIFSGTGLAGIVNFANDQARAFAYRTTLDKAAAYLAGYGVEFDGKDVETREQKGIDDVGGGVEKV